MTRMTAFLETYDLRLEIAIVRTLSYFHGVAAVCLDLALLPHSKVVVVGRDGDGRIMNTTGTLTAEFFSTCKFPKEREGGALFDFEGNFAGLNFFSSMGRSIFVPNCLISEKRLDSFEQHQQDVSPLRSRFLERLLEFKAIRVKEPLPGEVFFSHSDAYIDVPNKDQTEEIVSSGYPKPPLNSNCDMVLVHSFEERFGDRYPVGAWNLFKDKGTLDYVSQNVVALASFKGEIRIFACTGFFVECGYPMCSTILTSVSLVTQPSGGGNKIIESYTTKVLLPNKEVAKATLLSHNLHYNVALVGVDFYCDVPARLVDIEVPLSSKVVAVGCLFKSGVLMASDGERTCWTGQVPCEALSHSTCKITKAGIGGPLVNVDGDFIGMNFYDKKIGTPFVPSSYLLRALAFSKIPCIVQDKDEGVRGSVAEDPENMDNDWWPMPLPQWQSLTDHVVCGMSENIEF